MFSFIAMYIGKINIHTIISKAGVWTLWRKPWANFVNDDLFESFNSMNNLKVSYRWAVL